MEDKYLSVDIGKITVSVKMNDEGISLSLDVIKKHDPIGFAPIEEEVVESASKTYSEFGLEVKKIED
jgi:hypothetical protein